MWKGLLVSSPCISQWGDWRRDALGARHVHANVSVQQAAFEDHDAAGVHVAFDDGIGLDFDAFRRRHGPDNSTAEDDLFGLHVALDHSRTTEHQVRSEEHTSALQST